MDKTNATLIVYFEYMPIGILKLDAKRKFEFQYLEIWLNHSESFPLSLTLPLRRELYFDETVRPFFENILPESDVRKIIARQFGISENNIFGILSAIGGDCAGAISLSSDDGALDVESTELDYIPITENELENIITQLPTRPLMASKGLRLSLAGVQDKLPIYMRDQNFYLPTEHKPSSHILKPPIYRFRNTVINEYFCMNLAKWMGLPVPTTSIHQSKNPCYIIERFDRIQNNNGHLRRIHQEDFCQAMGVLSEQKYESEGGPSLQKCFQLVKEHSIQPAVDLSHLLNWVLFNFLIGNADAHGKNLALILTHEGPHLAPFYDMLSTAIYPELSSKSAMKIGKENRPDWTQKRHFERFSIEISIKFNFVRKVITTLLTKYANCAEKIEDFVATLSPDEQGTIREILALIEKRIKIFSLCLS